MCCALRRSSSGQEPHPRCGAARLPGGDPRFKNAQDAQNFLQETVIKTSRHGIPVSVYVEGLHGGPGGGTIFPSPVNLGNSWNVSLLKMVGAAVGHGAHL